MFCFCVYEGPKAFQKVEKKLFQLGAYTGDRVAEDFEGPPLRFPVGTRVECRMGSNRWAKGTVVEQRIFAMNREMPYKIELENGQLIFAPMDMDVVIRRAEEEIFEVSFRHVTKSILLCKDTLALR